MATGPSPLIRHLLEQAMQQQGMSGVPFGAREAISSTPLAPTQTPIALGPGNQPAALPRQASPWSTGNQPIPQRPAPSPREAWGRGVQRGPRATAARAGASRVAAGPANSGPANPGPARSASPTRTLTPAESARQIPFRQSAVTDTWGRPGVSPSGSLPPPPSGPLHGPFRPPPSSAARQQFFPPRNPDAGRFSRGGPLARSLPGLVGGAAAQAVGSGQEGLLGEALMAGGTGAQIGAIGGPVGSGVGAAGGGLAAALARPSTRFTEREVERFRNPSQLLDSDNFGDNLATGAVLASPVGSTIPLAALAERSGIPGISDAGSWVLDRVGSGERSLGDLPLIGDWFGGSSGDGGEEAVDPVAEQRARAASPDAMLGVLTASGLDGTQATEVLRTYEQEVQRNIALNSVGALGLGKDEKGAIRPLSDAPEGTEFAPLTDEDIRHMTAMDVYASIPEIMAEEERRLEGLQRAAVFQAMLGSTISPMNLANDQTNAQFQAAGDPLGALLSQNAHQARSAALMALPMTLAIDEQAEWDRRIAAIQQQQLMNQYLYPQEDQSVNPDEELFG